MGGSPESAAGNGLPFWSPGSRFIGFFANGALKKVDVTGGPAQTLCDAAGGEGGTWNADGTIVFAPSGTSGLFRVSAAGGAPTQITMLDRTRGERSHRWPWFLPDGRHFLYIAIPSTTLYVGSLDSAQRDRLFEVESKAIYADGHLLFTRNGSLFAQPFDAAGLRVTGEPFPIAEDMAVNVTSARAALSAASTGVLTYRTLGASAGSQLVWMDRSGKPGETLGEPAIQRGPQLSPDGTRVAVIVRDPVSDTQDLWIYDVSRGVRTRLTFDNADEAMAIWSPDGSRVIFNSRRRQHVFTLFQKAANGTGGEDMVLTNDAISKFATSWSPDGRVILYDTSDPGNAQKGDLWALPLEGERKPIPIAQTPFNELNGRFSPDGRWIAYQSDESGRLEVYVVPFDEPGRPADSSSTRSGKWRVSTSGGVQAHWRRDGKELFYIRVDGLLMAVPVRSQGSSFEVGSAQPLFEISRSPGGGGAFDVSLDGRFLVNRLNASPSAAAIVVVVNWTADIGKR